MNDVTQLATSKQADPGCWLVEPVLSPDGCDQLLAELGGERLARSRAGARHLLSHPVVSALARDQRLLDIARRGLGGSAVPFRATLFEKSGPSNWLVVWHQDTALPLAARFDAPDWGPWSEKSGVLYSHAPSWALRRMLALRVHLDDSSLENGPLRVIPKSHELGVLSDDDVFRLARERPAVDCVAPRGSVLAMRPLVVHSSPKSHTPQPRRVLHLEYADSLDLAAGIRLAVA